MFINAFTIARHLSLSKVSVQVRGFLCEHFVTRFFFTEELLGPPTNPKLKDHPLSALRSYLFNMFASTLHIEGRSSIRNLRTRHAVVTGTHLSRGCPETSV